MVELGKESQLKYDILTRRLQEVLGGDIIKQVLSEGRAPKCYWGESDMIVFERSSAERR